MYLSLEAADTVQVLLDGQIQVPDDLNSVQVEGAYIVPVLLADTEEEG
jgi:hypothetical protein